MTGFLDIVHNHAVFWREHSVWGYEERQEISNCKCDIPS